eukprot:jgi/Ulvmu1/3193/UM015_0234.1
MDLAAGVLLACCGVGGYLLHKLRSHVEVCQLKLDLAREKGNRTAERKGRIRAEQLLKALSQSQAAEGNSHMPSLQQGGHVPWSMRPIGTVASVFMQRNGTPRQPLLVPAARSRLTLFAHIPSTILEGLEQYTHCWIIYVFHLNTDLHQVGSAKGIKGKVRPPRLNGEALGVFATRTPHRPNPIGLSLCRIVRVGKTELVLGGADIVDGTPVLDVKPYVPFCECLTQASAPSWVADAADEEPLDVGTVEITDSMAEEIHQALRALPQQYAALVSETGDVCMLVRQVLSFDLRSLHRRQRDLREVYQVCVAGLLVDYVVSNSCG